jgi:hypothetical protein
VRVATVAAASCRDRSPCSRFEHQLAVSSPSNSNQELDMKIKTKVRAGRDCGGGKLPGPQPQPIIDVTI